jgi:hypothetical protein
MITWAHARRSLFTTLLAGACICLTVQIATAQSPGLNVSIIVFSPGIPADASTHRRLQVFPKIREFESRLLPFVLRETLVATHAWGAVRVVPEPDPAAELYLSGEILRSDGSTLELRFVAIDASGRVWLDKSYSQLASIDLESGRPASGARAYQALFGEVEHDLRIARDSLDDKALQDIVEISLLRYATELAPTAFEGFLNRDASGSFSINRLPAQNDPMLERIQRIRHVEYLMTDAVDEKFQELYAEIASTYAVWRKYRQQYAQYQIEEATWQENRKSKAPRGSYKAIESLYENYKWARLAEQEQEHWAKAFDNEVGPTVTRIESRVAELDDWVDNRYAEWNRLLAEIFELETGLGE